MAGPFHVEAPDPAGDRIVDAHFQGEANWVELIKDLRQAYNLSIHDAQKMALAHRGWRRWCSHRINTDPKCRSEARFHMRLHGAASLVVADGDRLRLRTGPSLDAAV